MGLKGVFAVALVPVDAAASGQAGEHVLARRRTLYQPNPRRCASRRLEPLECGCGCTRSVDGDGPWEMRHEALEELKLELCVQHPRESAILALLFRICGALEPHRVRHSHHPCGLRS
jgi:hypothetical protein